jgi:hypothetical protein
MPRGGARPGAGRPKGSQDKAKRWYRPNLFEGDQAAKAHFKDACMDAVTSGRLAQILQEGLSSKDPGRQDRAVRLALDYSLGPPITRSVTASVGVEEALIQIAAAREATIDVTPRSSTSLLPDRSAFLRAENEAEAEDEAEDEALEQSSFNSNTEPEPPVFSSKTPPPAPPPLRHSVRILGDPPLGVPLPEPEVLVMQHGGSPSKQHTSLFPRTRNH